MYTTLTTYRQIDTSSSGLTIDPLTVWVNAVSANGGTVSADRRTLMGALINGLITDGIYQLLDRLWIHAAENQPSALTDIVRLALATTINSPTFAIDRGFTGDGSTSYIDTNFNAATVSNPKYTQNDACIFAWHNTAGQDGDIIGTVAGGVDGTQLNPRFTDDRMFWTINGNQRALVNKPDAAGLYTMIRTNTPNEHIDINGVQFDSGTLGSFAPKNSNFAIGRAGATFCSRLLCAAGFGASLTAGQSTSLYNRLRTYLSAVGVP